MEKKTLQKKSQKEVTEELSMNFADELNSTKCRKQGYDTENKNGQNTQIQQQKVKIQDKNWKILQTNKKVIFPLSPNQASCSKLRKRINTFSLNCSISFYAITSQNVELKPKQQKGDGMESNSPSKLCLLRSVLIVLFTAKTQRRKTILEEKENEQYFRFVLTSCFCGGLLYLEVSLYSLKLTEPNQNVLLL